MRTVRAMGLALVVATGEAISDGTRGELSLGRTGAGLFTVEVTVAGHGPYTFLLDTGSQRTIVAPAVARMAGMTIYPGARLLMSAGAREVGQAWAPTLRVGAVEVTKHPLIVAELERMSRGTHEVDGILGHDVLGQVDYQLDVRHGRLTLGVAGSTDEAIVLPLTLDGRGRVVVEASVDARPLRMVLDSGATDVVVRRSAHARLGGGASGDVRVLTASTRAAAASTGAFDLTIGDARLHVPRAVLLDRVSSSETDGLLPLRLFEVVSVSHTRREVALVTRRTPSRLRP